MFRDEARSPRLYRIDADEPPRASAAERSARTPPGSRRAALPRDSGPHGKRAAAHVTRDGAPVGERIEQAVHDALLAPQHEQRALDAAIAHPRRRARGRSTPRRDSPRTLRGSSPGSRKQRSYSASARGSKMCSARAPASELAGAGSTPDRRRSSAREVEGLDQEEPVVVRGRERHVGLREHRPRRRDVEHGDALDRLRMIEAQAMRDAPAAIVAGEAEARDGRASRISSTMSAPSRASSTRRASRRCRASTNRRSRADRRTRR